MALSPRAMTQRTLQPWVAVAVVTLARIAAAQSIAPGDYVPFAEGAEWQYEKVSGDGPTNVHLEMTNVSVADTGTRALLSIPIQGLNLALRIELANDGRLLLRAIKADLDELLDDLPLDPTATADVQLDPPPVLGEALLVPGSAVTETPVDEIFDADLKTNVGDVDLDVHATGSITARWDPVAGPVVVPAGTFTDVVGFTIDIALRFAEDEFDSAGTLNVRVGGVLARDVGFIQLDLDGPDYALVRAVLDGTPIGDFPQYEDILGLTFTIPPTIALHDRALGESASGDLVLHDVRLAQTLTGKAQLDALVDTPSASGVPFTIDGPTTARNDGTLKVAMDGKVTIGAEKVKLTVQQRLDPTATTLDLTAKVNGVTTIIPVGIAPVVSGDVEIRVDGFVDASANPGSERKLSSNGTLRIGEVTYPIVARENLTVKKDGSRKRVYKFKTTDTEKLVVEVQATSTSAADFTVTKVTPTLFKLAIKNKHVTNVVADVVAP
jgi:hypothetical protein